MRLFSSIRWKITLAYFLVLGSIAALGFYLSQWTDDHYQSSLRMGLLAESRFIGNLGKPLLPEGPEPINQLAMQAGSDLDRRVTIIGVDGRVLGDSRYDYSDMESHNDRPEFTQALASGSGWIIRYSDTLHKRMLYVATRIGDDAHPLGVARIAEDLSRVDHARSIIHKVFFIGVLIVFIIAVLVGAMISSDVSTPISDMSAAARRFAKGDLDLRLNVSDPPKNEIHELANTLNWMASDLRNMLNELTVEKGKLQTIFDKADDGILLVDENARIQMINPVASRLLSIEDNNVIGQTVIEATLSHDISELISRVLRTGIPASLELQLQASEQLFVSAYLAPLENPDGLYGAMIVMHDLTTAKRIDSIRRDFVANVSHELRTPLASIRAMAETIILRGKKDGLVEKEFAQKIIIEADRLNAISEDLLDLAKIEAGRRVMSKERFAFLEVVNQVVSELQPKVDHKAIMLYVSIARDLVVDGDRDAYQQILINLIDNAVKYTPHGGRIEISAISINKQLVFHVADTGIGIPPEDLPRIFERFYRVDKARSRESGGTGLGLSIVKHLSELMGGGVSVTSLVGEGTNFKITLPMS